MEMDNKQIKAERLTRQEGTIISENKYNIIIGLTLLWGIGINILMATLLKPYILMIHPAVVFIGYLVISIGCMTIVFKSRNAGVSFAAFSGLAVAMGVIVTWICAGYTSATIYSAFLATGIIVVAMMILSMIFPAFFQKLGGVLFFALIGSIIVELIGGLIFHNPMNIMDYVIVVIFSGYVGYDWSRAQAYPKTTDNAVDSAADIYVDIINIFIRILSIMGKNSNN